MEQATPREAVDCIMPALIAGKLAPTDTLRDVSAAHLKAHWQELDEAGRLEAFEYLADTFARELADTVRGGIEGRPMGVGAAAFQRVFGTTPVFRGPAPE